jgi:hypothetical protein
MGVAADDGHAGQRGALLGAHHVHDALAPIENVELTDAVLATVPIQRLHLLPRHQIGDAVEAGPPIVRGDVVIRGRQIRGHPPGPAASELQALERLGRGDLMQQLLVDVEHGLTVLSDPHHMGIPDLVVKGLPHHHVTLASPS